MLNWSRMKIARNVLACIGVVLIFLSTLPETVFKLGENAEAMYSSMTPCLSLSPPEHCYFICLTPQPKCLSSTITQTKSVSFLT
ncbi:hypothetical protein M8J75_007063 [Diaphorina citri]|nr:hypothetical protein M8J75_007063 [Diaphorina citri]